MRKRKEYQMESESKGGQMSQGMGPRKTPAFLLNEKAAVEAFEWRIDTFSFSKRSL